MTKRIKIGITGVNGFIGYHLKQTLLLEPTFYEIIDFDRQWFDIPEKLDAFIRNCDVLVHLAGLNRHNDDSVILNTNLLLTNQVISSLLRTKSKPHVIFASSTQEMTNSSYGQSKGRCRDLFRIWAEQSNACFTGLIIPNVYGPFCPPNFNSVIATFSDKILRSEQPIVLNNNLLNLIYIDNLIKQILFCINHSINNPEYTFSKDVSVYVSDLLQNLYHFNEMYITKGEIPKLENEFQVNLFNTFRSYIDYKSFFPRKHNLNIDSRGNFSELLRTTSGGQFSFSTTHPGITRGNHFHTRKIERFCIIKGKAKVELRKIGTTEILQYFFDGDVSPAFIDMPVWYTHNITNIGNDTLYACFWINEPYNPLNPDTYLTTV